MYTDDNNSGGTRIQITSVGGEVSTYYMHLNTIEGFNEGDYVEEGTLIGAIGGSGNGIIGRHKPHLHYELQINGQYVNHLLIKII
ncbi:MAG: peptidoglycan DD-metalloendopeptidase family protein [Bacteroidales bacterium]|nr:peptidoglycan DD-metalloendopeptidase family protein [Bacteroidales bacterium]